MGRDITTQIEEVERKERENVFTILNKSKTYLLISLIFLIRFDDSHRVFFDSQRQQAP